MFRNLFFFVLGLGTGVYATLQGQKKAREVTPENIGRKVGRQAADRGVDVAKQVFSFVAAAADAAQKRTSEHLDEANARQATTTTTSTPTSKN
ncbi:hypothetical protein [Mariniluteicoccus flavus]